MAICENPRCGKEVPPIDAQMTTEPDNREHFFCSQQCLSEVKQAWEGFAAQTVAEELPADLFKLSKDRLSVLGRSYGLHIEPSWTKKDIVAALEPLLRRS